MALTEVSKYLILTQSPEVLWSLNMDRDYQPMPISSPWYQDCSV
jgi:hypothetical protein